MFIDSQIHEMGVGVAPMTVHKMTVEKLSDSILEMITNKEMQAK